MLSIAVVTVTAPLSVPFLLDMTNFPDMLLSSPKINPFINGITIHFNKPVFKFLSICMPSANVNLPSPTRTIDICINALFFFLTNFFR